MTDSKPSGLIALLREALDQDPSERHAWVSRVCAGDSILESRLVELLAQDQRSDLALDQPLESLVAETLLVETEGPQSGEQVGPFRLERKVGEGGMGSVWLADRVVGGFQQQVALKLIRLGMDSVAVKAQFRRERELLAQLQNADIARLLDGGIDTTGRPWFAMEYVEGASLREWSKRKDVDIDARLALLARLCRAVAYAHQHLIVHRDLKPSNVIVRSDGSPCLLDFGIAKFLRGAEGEQTATASRFLTRDYAAPEQLRGNAVTTSTDVFALGILFFEVLTGQEFACYRKDGGEIPRPSIAARTGRNDPTDIALARRLGGDLDAIFARAIAEEPQRRYATAQALAEDIENHLHGRAVLARPDSLGYRIGKFSRRHRAAVAVSAVSLVALLILSAVALLQAHAKAVEARNAQIALHRSESIRALLGSIFLSADPSLSRGAQTTVGELLQPARARLTRESAGDPELAAALLEQIGSTYVSLGEDALARETLSEALQFNRRAVNPSLQVDGTAMARLAYYQYLDGDAESSLRGLDAIIARLRDGGEPVVPVLAKALDLQSTVLFGTGKQDEALAVAAESLSLWERLGEANAADYVFGLIGYSDLAAAAGRNAEALDAAKRALAHRMIIENLAPGLTAAALGANARALQALGRNAEAEPMLIRVIAGFSEVFGAESGRTYYWRYRHGQVLQALGRLDEAQQEIDALIARPAVAEQPIAHVAYAVVGAEISRARRASDAQSRGREAVRLACSEQGNPRFCEKARALLQP
jgi:eukaryotic-like serine/threonine-protein kinase